MDDRVAGMSPIKLGVILPFSRCYRNQHGVAQTFKEDIHAVE
jgi:hypothetical protein